MFRYICGSVITLLSAIGLAANIAILFSTCVPKKKTIISLGLASLVFLLPNFLVYLPCSVSFCPFYDELAILLLSIPDTLGYYTYQLCLVHLSVDRILIFFVPNASKALQKFWASECFEIKLAFSKMHTVVAIWSSVVLFTVCGTCFGCHKVFNPVGLYFSFKLTSSEGSSFLKTFMFVCKFTFIPTVKTQLANGCAAVTMVCYLSVLVRIRIVHRRLNSSSCKAQEISLVRVDCIIHKSMSRHSSISS